MTLGVRKLVVVGLVTAVLLLANTGAIATWLHEIGLIPWAQSFRAEFLTGTALTIIVVLLILLPSRMVWAICVRRCPVCDCALLRRGKYCGECGSRV